MCGTPEFVAPEIIAYDFVSSATGYHIIKNKQFINSSVLLKLE